MNKHNKESDILAFILLFWIMLSLGVFVQKQFTDKTMTNQAPVSVHSCMRDGFCMK